MANKQMGMFQDRNARIPTGANHPPESFEAAESVKHRISKHEARVLDAIARCPDEYGMTAEEIEEATGLVNQTVTARLTALKNHYHFVEYRFDENKKKIRRKTRRNCWASAYFLTEKGWDVHLNHEKELAGDE